MRANEIMMRVTNKLRHLVADDDDRKIVILV